MRYLNGFYIIYQIINKLFTFVKVLRIFYTLKLNILWLFTTAFTIRKKFAVFLGFLRKVFTKFVYLHKLCCFVA